eukprot:UN25050
MAGITRDKKNYVIVEHAPIKCESVNIIPINQRKKQKRSLPNKSGSLQKMLQPSKPRSRVMLAACIVPQKKGNLVLFPKEKMNRDKQLVF